VFGLENKEDLKSKHDLRTFERLVSQFLSDARPDSDKPAEVNSRSKGADWKAYANKLQLDITDPPPESNPIIDHGKESKKNKEKQKSNSSGLNCLDSVRQFLSVMSLPFIYMLPSERKQKPDPRMGQNDCSSEDQAFAVAVTMNQTAAQAAILCFKVFQ
jgi:hypothetical protein